LKDKLSNKTDTIAFPESNYYENQLEYFISEINTNSKSYLQKLDESGERVQLIDKLFMSCRKINYNYQTI